MSTRADGDSWVEEVANAPVLQIKITLRGIEPEIWRRIQVPAYITLAQLHEAVQYAMGWECCHLHMFAIDGKSYGNPEFLDDIEEDENFVTLTRLVSYAGARLDYTYDFGDDWEHELVVEEVIPEGPDLDSPICLDGERNCPPEDCGGIWGYVNLIEAISDPKHEDHKLSLERVGGSFDSEEFDRDMANRDLACLVLI